MAKILVIRLSAIGDVAMTVPVLYAAAKANPEHTFVVLTQAFLIPVFINRPDNVEVTGISITGAEKSFRGLFRFAWAFSAFDFDIALDLHNVIRTMIIRTLFRLKGKKVFVVNKARKDRRRLTARKNKALKPIRPVIERYADVFKAAGLHYTDTFHSLFDERPANLSSLTETVCPKTGKWIGIAPFAKHKGKIYPLDMMKQIVEALSERADYTLFLLGAKGCEEQILQQWARQLPRVNMIVGRYTLDKELALISRLDLLLCMDSANMHFASLAGTRVLSVWGATHPYAGFYGYRQKAEDAIQLELACRPCSIFGEKPCFRGDWACLKQLHPQLIINKIKEILSA
ncbi:MAG: glycosyltransferase family 9 protein [Tannerellaceae bacterium]|jgi:ADP-heptose:LPS heptosyltransferase|nr:glycosyltransferase family 9 protein [Tannerellaceae bacterium]